MEVQRLSEATVPTDLPPEVPVAGEVPDEKAGSLKWMFQKLSEVHADPSAVAAEVIEMEVAEKSVRRRCLQIFHQRRLWLPRFQRARLGH